MHDGRALALRENLPRGERDAALSGDGGVTRRVTANIAASVRQRLYNLAQEKRESFDFVLSRFVAERLLFRLSVSERANDFVLKGALLFLVWSNHLYRPTRDVDLLGYGESSISRLEDAFRNLCRIKVVDDGLVFDVNSVRAASIREDQRYDGVRITLKAFLAKARVPLQIDIGFGDAITPGVEAIEFPLMLTSPVLPAPKLNAYPRETVIAEKLEAMVVLGIANSRMKDFYDLFALAQNFAFDGSVLVRAVRNTFARRGTLLPEMMPIALTREFSEDAAKTSQWRNFSKRISIDAARHSLPEVIGQLSRFLKPVLVAAGIPDEFHKNWIAGKGWRVKSQ
jgi:predicted nucleotidyltransferase component of viral defense system